MMQPRARQVGWSAAVSLLLACSSSANTRDQSTPRQQPTPAAAGQGSVEQLEQQAKALAKAEGCATSGECRAVPVGAKACGGPRYWLVYCARTTDETALLAKLTQLKAAEEERNRREGMVSTCDYAVEPQVEAVGGTCRAR